MNIVRDNTKEELQQLYAILKKNGWDISQEAPNEVRPYEMLQVKIYATVGGKDIYWPAELSFLNGLEEELKTTNMMQCFVPLVVQVPASLNGELMGMITRINTKLPLVGFGLLESHALVYFKHNLLLPQGETAVTEKIMQETMSMISYLLFNFFEAFLDVAMNKKTVKEAMETMPFSRLYV